MREGLRIVSRGLARILGSATHNSLEERLAIESVLDRQTIVMSDGSLVTAIRLIGSMRPNSGLQLEASAIKLGERLASAMASGQHSLQFSLVRDSRQGLSRVAAQGRRIGQAAKAAQLDLLHVLSKQPDHLLQFCEETILLSLLTRHTVRSGHCGKPIGLLADTTKSMVITICSALQNAEQLAEILDSGVALEHLKQALCPMSRERHQQVWTLPRNLDLPDCRIEKSQLSRIGDSLFRSLDLIALPNSLMPINDLLAAVREVMVTEAWRCSIFIEPHGLSSIKAPATCSDLAAVFLAFEKPTDPRGNWKFGADGECRSCNYARTDQFRGLVGLRCRCRIERIHACIATGHRSLEQGTHGSSDR